ncbi:MAG: 30S ribosomal protein THX [Gammaproteobacteria bacterium]|nr:30S ribosomal protein THX [Gammaproteobacteria bacterium]
MGKGDIRTRRGKINRGTTGKSRKKASKLRRERAKKDND